MIRTLLILFWIVSLYSGYMVHDSEQFYVLNQFMGCLLLYALVLTTDKFDRIFASVTLLLAFFELVDELRNINTELFIADIIIDLIAIIYLLVQWRKSGMKY